MSGGGGNGGLLLRGPLWARPFPVLSTGEAGGVDDTEQLPVRTRGLAPALLRIARCTASWIFSYERNMSAEMSVLCHSFVSIPL